MPASTSTVAELGWAIVGPGSIAGRFAQALQALPGQRLQAVWGRRPQRVSQWLQQHQLDPALARAELRQLLDDPAVGAVYIATSHDVHAAYAEMALAAGKPVLCEKPLTCSAAATAALLDASARHRVFLMEALWTRMLPVYAGVANWLREGRIGALRSVSSSFCFPASYDPDARLFNPALGGGALLDIGIYNVAMTRWALATALGDVPPLLTRHLRGELAATGVESAVSAQLDYAGGVSAQFVCAFDRFADNRLVLHGSRGCIAIDAEFWGATQASLQLRGEAAQILHAPHRVNGFEYQILEAARCIGAGLLQSPCMPHQESLQIARELDALRELAGVRPIGGDRPLSLPA